MIEDCQTTWYFFLLRIQLLLGLFSFFFSCITLTYHNIFLNKWIASVTDLFSNVNEKRNKQWCFSTLQRDPWDQSSEDPVSQSEVICPEGPAPVADSPSLGGLTLAVPLHTVYLRGAAEAPSHPALRLILYNLWKMSHTQQHRTLCFQLPLPTVHDNTWRPGCGEDDTHHLRGG